MRAAFAALCVVCVALAACGGGDDGGNPPAADAMEAINPDALAACVNQGELVFGVCQLADGTPCTGASDPGQRWVDLAPGGTVPAVVGFQGLFMYALAVRTSGIDPGDESVPEQRPLVDIALFDDTDQFVSSYQRQVAFMPVTGASGQYEMLSVYLVVGSGTELLGKTLRASGSVVDKDGVTKCGEHAFVGSEL